MNSWVVDPVTANTEEFNPKLQLSKAEIIIVGCFKLSYVVGDCHRYKLTLKLD